MAAADQYTGFEPPVEPRGPGTSDPLGISPLTLIKRAPAGPDDPLGIYPLRVVGKEAAPLSALKKEAAQRKPAALAATKIKLPQGYKLDAPAGSPSVEKAALPERFMQTLPTNPASISAAPATPAPDDFAAQTRQGLQTDRDFLVALGHNFGIGKDELLTWAKRMREHPVEGALEMVPAYAGPKAILGEGKRVLGELGEAGKALGTEGQPLSDRLGAAASHAVSAIPLIGAAKDAALDEYVKAGGGPVSLAEDITDPKKYLTNLKIATDPKVLAATTGAAIQAGTLLAGAAERGYKALGDAYEKRATTPPEFLPPSPELPAPAVAAEPPTLEGRTGQPQLPPGRPALPAPTEGLTPAEQELEKVIDDRVSEHPETEVKVQRDLQNIPPEDRQAVLDSINQEGIEAYRRGDKKAAAEAVQHAWILKGIMQAEERAARAARIAARPDEATPEESPTLFPPAESEPPTAVTAPEAAAQPAPRRARRAPVATAEAEQTALPFSAPAETEAPLAVRETPVPEAATEDTPQTVGQLASEIESTMSRDQMVKELGVQNVFNEVGVPLGNTQLAMKIAMQRLGTGVAKPKTTKNKAKTKKEAQAAEKAPAAIPPAPATPATPDAPAPKTGKSKKKAAPEPEPEAEAGPDKTLTDFFTPGNVIYNGYWGNFDKVLDFKPTTKDGGWLVQVIESDKNGNPLPGERPRWHSTYPDTTSVRPDKVIVRAPEPAPVTAPPEPATPATPEPTPEPEPGYVAKVADKIGKRKKKAAPATTEPAPASEAAPPAPEPAAPVTGPVAVKRIAGSVPPTWQVPDTDYTVRLVNGSFDIYKDGEYVGKGSELEDAKAQIQTRLAAPETKAAHATASPEEIEKSHAEARARGRAENAKLAIAEKAMRHGTPVIALNDDAMVLLDRLAGTAMRSNGLILNAEKARKVLADLRQLVGFDPQNRQGLATLADLMDSHRTPNRNVVFHRSILPDEKINQIALEELFHDWQHRHIFSAKKLFPINLAMRQSPSADAWNTVISNLVKLHGYGPLVATVEAPAWVASGDYAHLGITPEQAVKLLADYFEQAHKLVGDEAVNNLPPMTEELKGKVQDEIRSRNLGKPRKDVSGRNTGRVDTHEPATAGLPEELPRGAGPKGRKGTEAELAQSRQPSNVDFGDAPEGKRRPIKTFVSPNVFNLDTITDAQRRLHSKTHKLMTRESDWLLDELGTKVKSRSGLGIWEDGAENSLIHEYPADTDPDLVAYHNALMARAGHQKFLLNFFPQDDARDVLYRITVPKSAGDPSNISKVLADHGIKASTILDEYDGHAVIVATSAAGDDETKHAVLEVAKKLGGKNGARVRRTGGRSEYVGDDDRGRAGKVFSRIIAEQENLHPRWRDIRTRLESRPGYNELWRLAREVDSPSATDEFGELQSRQRLDSLKDEVERRKPIALEPGVDPEEVILNRKNNLNWDDIKDYLLPVEREAYEKKPELQRKIVSAVNMMPNVDEWDAAVKAGKVGHLWYERSARAFDALISSMPEAFEPKDKEKFLNFVSALSPVQTVRLNLMMAIDLWDKWNKAGRPTDVEWSNPKKFTGVADKKAKLYRLMAGLEKEEVPPEERGGLFRGKRGSTKKRSIRGVDLDSRLYNAIRALQGQPLSGPKVSAFAPNLGKNIDKSTNDTWMAVFADTDPNTINQKHLYDAVSAHVRIAAEKNDIPTRQAQAAIWSFIKSLAELSGWGANRWIPPQEIIDRNILNPESVEAKSQDFADLMLHDYGIRAKLSKIGADLNVLDRKIARFVPAKPTVDEGSIKELAERLSGAARRLEAIRDNERVSRHLERKSESRQGGFFPPPEDSPIRRAISLERAKAEAAPRDPRQ